MVAGAVLLFFALALFLESLRDESEVLELYEAEGLIYHAAGGFPGVEISLASEMDVLDPPMWCASEMVDLARCVVRADAEVTVDSGMLVVRASRMEQFGVRGLLALLHGWQRAIEGLNAVFKTVRLR